MTKVLDNNGKYFCSIDIVLDFVLSSVLCIYII